MSTLSARRTTTGEEASLTRIRSKSAAVTSSVPAPRAKGSSPGALAAVCMRRAFTWSGVSAGSFCSMRAAAPATMGAAMLVPDISK